MTTRHPDRAALLWAGLTALTAPLTAPLLGQTSWEHAHHYIAPLHRGFTLPQHQAVKIERVHAKVAILEQTARTTLVIDLYNPSPTLGEAVLLLPVPAECAVSGFAFDGPAAEPTARLLPADEARRTYDEIVRRVRDPGLLEFAGARLIRSSVFPIAAGGRSKVTLTYEHLLEADGDRFDYVLLRSEALDQSVPWAIDVQVAAKAPIAMLYSPSHQVNSEKRSAREFRVRLAESGAPAAGSFRLSYLVERPEGAAASLFAYPDPKIGGGYFLLLIGAPAALPRKPAPREVTLVLDRSGSMAGEKMDQARAAVRQVIEALEEGEFFNLIDYSTTVERFAAAPVRKDAESLAQVRKYIDSLRPIGGTNIHDALLDALRQPQTQGALPLVLFLTDGLPTVGQTAERTIAEMVAKGNAVQRRVFTFGVGHDVNVPLLDRVAESTRATSTFVLPKEDVEIKVGRVFKRLHGPVLENPELLTADAQGKLVTTRVRERYPQQLSDVFEGDSLVVLGQYRNEDDVHFVYRGQQGASAREFRFKFSVAQASTKNSFVPRLWASRRVADLIDQVRQSGADTGQPRPAGSDPFADPKLKELRDEILRLSTEFGILTEYTAFLATEGTQLGDLDALKGACQSNLSARAWNVRSGIDAINQSVNLRYFGKEQQVLNPSNYFFDTNLNAVATTAVQQVCDRAFFRRGNQWIDGRLVQGGNLTPARTITFGSSEHQALLQRLVREGRQGTLSLTGEIVMQLDGEVIAVRN